MTRLLIVRMIKQARIKPNKQFIRLFSRTNDSLKYLASTYLMWAKYAVSIRQRTASVMIVWGSKYTESSGLKGLSMPVY